MQRLKVYVKNCLLCLIISITPL